MPQIREYTNPITEIRPNDKAMNAAANLADATGKAGYYRAQAIRQTGNDFAGAVTDAGRTVSRIYEQQVVKKEISQGAALFTGADDDSSKEWNAMGASTDPNDASIIEKQRVAVRDRYDKIVESFETAEGRQWAEGQRESRLRHWNEKTAADGAARSGAALKQNFDTMKNNIVTSVSNDPTSIDINLKMLDSTIPELASRTPNLDPKVSAVMQTQLLQGAKKDVVQAGLYAMITKNPERGAEVLASGKYRDYLDENITASLTKLVTVSQKRIEQQGVAAANAATKAQKAAVEDRSSKIMTDDVQVSEDGILSVKPSFFWNAQNMAGMPHGADKARTLMAWGQAVNERLAKGIKAKDDPTTFDDFTKRAYLDPSDPNALTTQDVQEASWANKLSDKSTATLMAAVKESRSDPKARRAMTEFNAFTTQIKPAIVKSSIINDEATGAQQFLLFVQDKKEEFAAGRKAGLSTQELLSPRSPNYIGRDLNNYTIPREKAAENLRAKLQGTARQLQIPEKQQSFGDRFQGDGSVQTTVPAAPAVKWKQGMSMDDLDKALGGK